MLYASSLEIDFVIRNNDYPLLVEVKATNNYAKSLNMVMLSNKDYGEDNIKAIKIYSKNIVLNNNDVLNREIKSFILLKGMMKIISYL